MVIKDLKEEKEGRFTVRFLARKLAAKDLLKIQKPNVLKLALLAKQGFVKPVLNQDLVKKQDFEVFFAFKAKVGLPDEGNFAS